MTVGFRGKGSANFSAEQASVWRKLDADQHLGYWVWLKSSMVFLRASAVRNRP